MRIGDARAAPASAGAVRRGGGYWGYVVKGNATFTFADRQEHFAAGEAFYVLPGHTPAHSANSELVLFSPADELRATVAAMRRNMAATAS